MLLACIPSDGDLKMLKRRVKTLNHRVNKVPDGKLFRTLLDERVAELAHEERKLEEMKKKIVLRDHDKALIMKHNILPEREMKLEATSKTKNDKK